MSLHSRERAFIHLLGVIAALLVGACAHDDHVEEQFERANDMHRDARAKDPAAAAENDLAELWLTERRDLPTRDHCSRLAGLYHEPVAAVHRSVAIAKLKELEWVKLTEAEAAHLSGIDLDGEPLRVAFIKRDIGGLEKITQQPHIGNSPESLARFSGEIDELKRLIEVQETLQPYLVRFVTVDYAAEENLGVADICGEDLRLGFGALGFPLYVRVPKVILLPQPPGKVFNSVSFIL